MAKKTADEIRKERVARRLARRKKKRGVVAAMRREVEILVKAPDRETR